MSLSLAKFLKYTDLLNLPDTDELGNIRAQVGLRYDLLEELEAVTDAIEGELAIASDIDCGVTYKGNPLLPHIVAFDYTHKASVNLEGTIGSNSGLVIGFEAGSVLGTAPEIVDTTTNNIIIPTWVNIEISKAIFDVHLQDVPADATYVSVTLEIDNGFTGQTALGGAISPGKITQTTDAYFAQPSYENMHFHFDLNLAQIYELNRTGPNLGLRVVIAHNGTTSWAMSNDGKCSLQTMFSVQAK